MSEQEITEQDIVNAIEARVAKNDREQNSTWNAATRVEIAAELDVGADQISREGGKPDGPLGAAVDSGRVVAHPTYDGYWMTAEVTEHEDAKLIAALTNDLAGPAAAEELSAWDGTLTDGLDPDEDLSWLGSDEDA